MRIFYSFLVIMTATFLLLLPLTAAIYDFRTDVREDRFTSTTGVGQATDNFTLSQVLYDSDNSTIDIISSISDDAPLFSSYNVTSRLLGVEGLAENTTRSISIFYDTDALVGNNAINTLLDNFPYIWLICVIAFAPAALVAIFMGRAG